MTKSARLSSGTARQSRVALSCTLALLVAVSVDRFVLGRPSAHADAYHESVGDAAEQFPFQFDRWLGVEVPIPQSAITMLKPNFIISRNYQELGKGRSVTLLVVH